MTAEYARVLKNARLRSGLSVKEVAARLDVSEAAIYKIEKGQVSRSAASVSAMARLVGAAPPTTALYNEEMLALWEGATEEAKEEALGALKMGNLVDWLVMIRVGDDEGSGKVLPYEAPAPAFLSAPNRYIIELATEPGGGVPIRKGALAMIESSAYYRPGDTVLAIVDSKPANLKKFIKMKSGCFLFVLLDAPNPSKSGRIDTSVLHDADETLASQKVPDDGTCKLGGKVIAFQDPGQSWVMLPH